MRKEMTATTIALWRRRAAAPTPAARKPAAPVPNRKSEPRGRAEGGEEVEQTLGTQEKADDGGEEGKMATVAQPGSRAPGGRCGRGKWRSRRRRARQRAGRGRTRRRAVDGGPAVDFLDGVPAPVTKNAKPLALMAGVARNSTTTRRSRRSRIIVTVPAQAAARMATFRRGGGRCGNARRGGRGRRRELREQQWTCQGSSLRIVESGGGRWVWNPRSRESAASAMRESGPAVYPSGASAKKCGPAAARPVRALRAACDAGGGISP